MFFRFNVIQVKIPTKCYIWKCFKKCYKWTYSLSRNRLTDIENKLMVTKGDSGGGGRYIRSLKLTYTKCHI